MQLKNQNGTPTRIEAPGEIELPQLDNMAVLGHGCCGKPAGYQCCGKHRHGHGAATEEDLLAATLGDEGL